MLFILCPFICLKHFFKQRSKLFKTRLVKPKKVGVQQVKKRKLFFKIRLEKREAMEIELSNEELKSLDQHFPEGAFAGTRYATPQMGMVVN